jgi:hypothetical protein
MNPKGSTALDIRESIERNKRVRASTQTFEKEKMRVPFVFLLLVFLSTLTLSYITCD